MAVPKPVVPGTVTTTAGAASVAATASPHAVSGRLDALDSVRALAALHVFMVHYVSLFAFLFADGSPVARSLRASFMNSFQGAYLFFVLSGFLIYRSLLIRQQPLGQYMGRRVRRIYPTFAAVFTLYLALSVIFPARSKIPGEGVLPYLLSNAALLPGVFPIRPVVTVTWTLSYELFFYLGIGLLVAGLGMRSWAPSSRALFFLGTAALYLALGDVFGLRLGPFLMFLPGILLFDLIDQRTSARRPPPTLDLRPLLPLAAAMILAAVAFAGFRGPVGGLETTAATLRGHAGIGLLFGLLVWMSLGGSRHFSRLCLWGPLRWLGGISYSFYLIHGLALGAIALLLKPLVRPGAAPALFWIGLPFALGAATIVAWALFAGVERRFSLLRAPRESPPQSS